MPKLFRKSSKVPSKFLGFSQEEYEAGLLIGLGLSLTYLQQRHASGVEDRNQIEVSYLPYGGGMGNHDIENRSKQGGFQAVFSRLHKNH